MMLATRLSGRMRGMPTNDTDLAKLAALHEAARIGFAALDRGEFVEFDSMDELTAYLMAFSEEVISSVAIRASSGSS